MFASALECAVALYVSIEVLAGRGYVDSCASLGTFLNGEMLAHRLLAALAGG